MASTTTASSSVTAQQQHKLSRYVDMSRHPSQPPSPSPSSPSSVTSSSTSITTTTKPPQEQEQQWEWEIALAPIGEANVGKATFASRCVQGRTSGPLSEVPRLQRNVDHEGVQLTWDAHGTFDLEEKGKHTLLQTKMMVPLEGSFHVSVSWYRYCVGFFVLFDLSDHESFEAVPHYVKELTETSSGRGDILPKVFIVGNKCDLARAVTPDEIHSLCSELGGAHYFEVSCYTGQGLEECWSTAVASTYHDLLAVTESQDSQQREEKRNQSQVPKKKKVRSTDGCALS
ncbi:hypothetical protein Pelo_9499 [Pelomyxa schiedti]|nr:hypothetical protein Pelo_9499 [Pelomyxa schiedti]